ncbi:hypothetical protein EHI8A_026550 [Entamoeba histolytica HM-1:IMSS-B]|uniref:Uncharacterized protein n=5 Tax=Entamoeba histolytica TaxID=5759 RepID=C4M0H0_ENTH1|nr:hypothetical protein EHI_006970 [Entamoeba histolytica HM-1:IMSS]EMD44424.1 Hypothetical protein EHI5A_045080 [Entamoeba histolytica KU27]EMH74300.1 hypothetical protein EHI8A_026550 [Entamoeba histolytica HM-1:IMSS-B]ENY62211.1 hypothetical protein EHI7A_165440 [Entamoeba histolytica HM-1:IMSS-A]GAT94657.1 hypothetical protein CL6EHI_006970 [Entamoeba histolytica]EAL49061.1 hypothetical protein EHI_006970 [Entamoeba histolytica HM-1:IMSS]|eukprot:XP_654448.1 hypothetical protein EHI_006970 [Entamoeba histolytica HM-1:IMSS]
MSTTVSEDDSITSPKNIQYEIDEAIEKLRTVIDLYNKALKDKNRFEEVGKNADDKIELLKRDLQECLANEQKLQNELIAEKEEHEKAEIELKQKTVGSKILTARCLVYTKDGMIEDVEMIPWDDDFDASADVIRKIKKTQTNIITEKKEISENLKNTQPQSQSKLPLSNEQPTSFNTTTIRPKNFSVSQIQKDLEKFEKRSEDIIKITQSPNHLEKKIIHTQSNQSFWFVVIIIFLLTVILFLIASILLH